MEQLSSARNVGSLESATAAPRRRHDRDLRATLDGRDRYDDYACPVATCARLVPGLFDLRFIDGLVDVQPHLVFAWCLADLRSAERDGQICAIEILGQRGRPLVHVLSGAA